MKELLSKVALSCLFTKGVSAATATNQRIEPSYTLPTEEARLLCAQLILEEALETVKALGFSIGCTNNDGLANSINDVDFYIEDPPNMMKIIDGCCDTIYVATGTLMACGVPDIPHLEEVCRANDSKFPGGVAIVDQHTGKYLKPSGWRSPNHTKVMSYVLENYKEDLAQISKELVEKGKS